MDAVCNTLVADVGERVSEWAGMVGRMKASRAVFAKLTLSYSI